MARPGHQAGVAGAPPDPAQQIDALEAQLHELSTVLAGRVAAAQAETLGAQPGPLLHYAWAATANFYLFADGDNVGPSELPALGLCCCRAPAAV